MAVLVLLALALAQAVNSSPIGCGCGYTGYGDLSYGGYGYPGYGDLTYGGCGYPGYGDLTYGGYGYAGYGGFAGAPCGYEVGCCPGPVIEECAVVQTPVRVPFAYTEPTFSKQCFQSGTVARDVVPLKYESNPVCETVQQITTLPTTDITVVDQPLCKTTCTTSEYTIAIPIVETTCTSSPLCKKSIRAQDNLLTTVSRQTNCAKQVCSQNQVIEQPFVETVCQNFQGGITKTGVQTVLQPEVVKSCVQLPPYPCLKPASEVVAYGGAFGYPGGVEYFGDYGFGGYGVVEAGCGTPACGGFGGYPGYGIVEAGCGTPTYGGFGGYPGYGVVEAGCGTPACGGFGGYPGYSVVEAGCGTPAYGGFGYGCGGCY